VCSDRYTAFGKCIEHAQSPLREVLGCVLGEVATPSLGLDLLQFAADEIDELRAAAARGRASGAMVPTICKSRALFRQSA
jgi:hypothetical protein